MYSVVANYVCLSNFQLCYSPSTYKVPANLYSLGINFFFLPYFQRNGADFSVFINTAQEFDGSDSGARPDEAVSWGKIKMDAKPVKVIEDWGDMIILYSGTPASIRTPPDTSL